MAAGLDDYQRVARNEFPDTNTDTLQRIHPPLHQGNIKIGGPTKTRSSRVNGAILDRERITVVPLCGMATIVGSSADNERLVVGCVSDSTLGTQGLTIIDTVVDALGDPKNICVYGLITQEFVPKQGNETLSSQRLQQLITKYGNQTQTILAKLLRQRGLLSAHITLRLTQGIQNRIVLINPVAPV